MDTNHGHGDVIFSTRDIDIELRSKVKAKATLERKTMREVIFEGLREYITPAETSPPDKKKAKKKDRKRGRTDVKVSHVEVLSFQNFHAI